MKRLSRLEDLRFDVVAAGAGLLVAALLFPLRFFATQIFILTIPLVLGGACVIYLLSVYWNTGRGEIPALPTPVARSLPGIVFAGAGAIVFAVALAGARSPAFHAISTIVGTTLVLQVVFTRQEDFRIGLVIGEIVVFSLVVRLAALYATPGFIGIDVWTHMNLAGDVLDAGTLSAIDENKYFASPLFHLYVVAASWFLELPLRGAMYVTLGLVMALSILLVYATTELLVDPRWAALATLVYGVGDYVVQWGIHLIPTSLGLAVYLAMLYGLVRVTRSRFDLRDHGLLLFLSVVIILTHQVSSFIMVVTLGGAILTQVIIRLGLFDPPGTSRSLPFQSRDPTTLAGLFAFNLGLITFTWSLTPYKGDTFLKTVLSYLHKTLVSSVGFLDLAGGNGGGAGGAGGAAPTALETFVTYLDASGYLLLMFVTFLGCLYVVNRLRAEQPVIILVVATALMMVFVMGLPILGIRNFIPGRWYAFLYAPMAILAVIGIRHVAAELDARVVTVLILLFAATYPGAMLFSSDATIDNPVFEDQRAELAYNTAELHAVEDIEAITGSPAPMDIRRDQVAYTDHPYQTVIDRQGAHQMDAIEFNGTGPATHDITIYRRAQTTEATYFRVNGVAANLNVERERVCRPSQNVLYSNGAVLFCTTQD